MSAAAVFAGYAQYSAKGDGFTYALTNATAPTTPGAAVVLVSDVQRALSFFPFLFLLAGVVLGTLLLALLLIAFCCRRHTISMELRCLRLQRTHAELCLTLAGEVLDRTPVRPAPPTKRPEPPKMQRHRSSSSRRSARTSNSPPQPPQQQGPQQQQQSFVLPPSPAPPLPPLPITNRWMLTPEPFGVFPPRQPPTQPLFPESPTAMEANCAACNYNNMYFPVPILAAAHKAASPSPEERARASEPEQQGLEETQSDTSSATGSITAPAPTLRRRTSRVSFIGAE
ncbi:hypothetical protein ABB37_08373 [Leptomonas pyrrhocoris]|uniref:Uncharacterized protein n=1 Tax=Leptomonas pyrrhocoris TaxID=157538 RepID=A0A0M9FT57_LEPPY|nr:hypothetical protein ABB37_08373 [Leptomonas pyrrhocoris]XP_015653896.1 hypothetical protein ABB37_08373 [Leptomonas pyrrhocoris]KPA75456.1 hypothetical protein ABB37_08373 [Leptomonas pyrrhocoris]KPA75457.1 hypothetical protein ABB37_08373 [Leptomonas pyrrhocoris]|eukprot:XP_015653895.1 hypothetical protein ABB37_08373 [Leptomonas pyrrhocoris]